MQLEAHILTHAAVLPELRLLTEEVPSKLWAVHDLIGPQAQHQVVT